MCGSTEPLKLPPFLCCVQRKCEVYWGNTLGSVYDAGAGISVHLKQLLQFPDYKIRVFCVTNVSI